MGIRVSASSRVILIVLFFISLAFLISFGFKAYVFNKTVDVVTEVSQKISQDIIQLATPKFALQPTTVKETKKEKPQITWASNSTDLSSRRSECNLAISKLLYDNSYGARENKKKACNY